MSNQIVGNVYGAIIDKVIQVSQNDFEEYGIDQRTLLAMKESWQQKLSGFRTAAFPWDPTPAPAASNPPTLPSNGKETESPTSGPGANGNYPGNPAIKREPNVKTESSYQPYQAPPGLNLDVSQRRAQELIQQRRQEALNQQRFAQPNQGAGASNGLPPTGNYPSQQPRMNGLPQVGGPMPSSYPQQSAPQQQSNTIKGSQVDGGSDSAPEAFAWLPEHSVPSEAERCAIDASIAEKIQAQARITDSGLFTTLKEQQRSNRRAQEARARLVAGNTASSSSAPPTQLDGDYDDDDKKYLGIKDDADVDDEDAINSDLDDSEDELRDAEAGDDQDGGHAVDTMLCTYDKVQRVKNKWKATLKDGIICTGGRDYLFHKANGEFEW